MDWKEEARRALISNNAKAIHLMLDHWPGEPEQHSDPCCSCDHWRSIVILAADVLGADSYESTSVDHAAKRVVKDRDDLKIQLDGIHMRLSDVGFVKDEETIASSVWDLVDAWESACKERDRLQAKQRDDAKSVTFMAHTIQAAHEALGTEVGDDLAMACQRFRKERERLQDALAEQMDENRRLTRKLEEAKAAKPSEPTVSAGWREDDLVRWENGEEVVQGRLMLHPATGVFVLDDILRIKTCHGHLYRPAAECTLIKRAGE
jgi:hypothetical protein